MPILPILEGADRQGTDVANPHPPPQKGHKNLTKSEQLRIHAGIRLLADRKGVPVSELEAMPLEKIEKDIRAARVTTWDIARHVAIAQNLRRLYDEHNIPEEMVISEAIAQGIITRSDALSCYAVMPEDIEAIVREHQWVAA